MHRRIPTKAQKRATYEKYRKQFLQDCKDGNVIRAMHYLEHRLTKSDDVHELCEAFALACRHKHKELAKEVIKLETNILYHYPVMLYDNHWLDLLELLRGRCSFNHALLTATERGDINMMQIMIDLNADNVDECLYKTAFKPFPKRSVVDLLIQNKADVNKFMRYVCRINHGSDKINEVLFNSLLDEHKIDNIETLISNAFSHYNERIGILLIKHFNPSNPIDLTKYDISIEGICELMNSNFYVLHENARPIIRYYGLRRLALCCALHQTLIPKDPKRRAMFSLFDKNLIKGIVDFLPFEVRKK